MTTATVEPEFDESLVRLGLSERSRLFIHNNEGVLHCGSVCMIPVIIMRLKRHESASEQTFNRQQPVNFRATFRRLPFAIQTRSNHDADGGRAPCGLRSRRKTDAKTAPGSIPFVPVGYAVERADRICSSETAAIPNDASPSRILVPRSNLEDDSGSEVFVACAGVKWKQWEEHFWDGKTERTDH